MSLNKEQLRERIEYRQNQRLERERSVPNTEELTAAGGGPLTDVGSVFAAELAKNPDDLVLAAKGGSLKIYEKVLLDDQVFSTFQQRRLALLSKEVEVLPGATDKQSVACADHLRDVIAGTEFDKICNKMMYGVFYGHAVGECLWQRDGKHWGLETVKVRKARRFKYDNAGRLRLETKSSPNGLLMEDRKFWTFDNGSDNDDNPYGIGLAAWCYWPAYFKRNGLRWWMLAMEKYGAPTAVGKYPHNATPEEKKKLLEAVMAFASVSGVTIPEGMNIELLTAGARVGMNHETLFSAMNASISKVVLSQTMTTDDGSSKAQGQVHENVADDITAADADLQCGSFMQGPGTWMRDWNYAGAALPVLRRQTEAPEDLNQQVERDRQLYEMGYEPTEEHIARTYGDGYRKRVVTDNQDADQAKKTSPEKTGPEFKEFIPQKAETSVERFLQSEDHTLDLENEMDGMISKIEAMLENVGTDGEALSELTKLLEIKSNDEFAERLARATFNARLHGRSTSEPQERA